MEEIPNAELRPANIPPPDADRDALIEFAHTHDGYRSQGGFEACAKLARARAPRTLTELRSCLFFRARSLRHDDEGPDPRERECWGALLRRIRAKLEAGDTA